MKSKDQFRDVYTGSNVLHTKLDIHARYSSIPIDLPAEIAARCGAPNDLAVLDIGCGTGHLIEHLARIGHRGRLVGLDLVPPEIADTDGKQYVIGDAEDLPFPDDGFDIVTCIHTLSHLGDITAAMNAARHVLRSAGTYLATANSLYAYPRTAEYRRRIHSEFGWGEPTFTTTHVNAENLPQTLCSHWDTVTVEFLDGELRIPVDEYATYFAATIPTWDRAPAPEEEPDILRRVDQWARCDQHDGQIIEPKRVALATCFDG